MNYLFSREQLDTILKQSMMYACACPAQICKTIKEQRALYTYQQECLNQDDTDKAVHQAIADAIEETHPKLEACLKEVLTLEGWDLETLEMPAAILKKLMGDSADFAS
jgi:hypothetical protein